MGRLTNKSEWRIAGDRPVLGPVLTGIVGLLGGVLVGRLGVWVAVAIVGPFEFGDPMDLFGNAIRLLGPLLVVSAGAVAGFLLGTVALPALVMFGLGWDRAARTVGYLLLLLCGVVPLTFWILLQTAGDAESTGGGLWLAGMVVGGLTPAVARGLARRNRPDRDGGAPTVDSDGNGAVR